MGDNQPLQTVSASSLTGTASVAVSFCKRGTLQFAPDQPC